MNYDANLVIKIDMSNETTFINIGETIAAARKRKGLSQKQLADRAGISQSHLARIELGIMCPTIRTAEHILLELGMKLWVVRNTF